VFVHVLSMNSASQPHQHPHQHHAQLSFQSFGQLPPTTYETAVPASSAHHQAQLTASAQPTSAPITVDTSSPPLNYSQYHPGPGGQPQQPPSQPPPTQASNGTSQGSTSGGGQGGRRGPGSIKWTKEGVSTSAERRLPFVHRFRPVDLPPPVGLVNAPGSGGQQAGQQQATYSHAPGALGPHVSKALNKMSQYETNPVGALQERYQSRGVLPSYRVVQFEGMSHNPVFTYQVTIGDMSTMGSGNSKKQAKHAAARAMLDKIDGRVPATGPGMNTPAGMPQPNLDNKTITSQSGTEAISQSNGANGTPGPAGNGIQGGSPGNAGNGTGNGTSLPSNPIGSLQEYCVKCSLPLPIYDLQNTSGQPHQRNFEIIAKVGAIASNGTGTSKKDAKRDAATALLDKLKALGSEVASAAGATTNGTEVDEELAKQVSNMKVDILTPKHSKVLQDFYHKLQDSGKAKLLALVRTSLRDPKLDCVRLLGELSAEQNFDVTYVDIEERNATGDVQCLVQISTMPVAVCHGTGVDQSAANNVAARNALEYLKIMVKKPTPITQSNQGKNGNVAPVETTANGKKVAGK